MVRYLQFKVSTRLGHIGYTFFQRLASVICFPVVWHGLVIFFPRLAPKSHFPRFTIPVYGVKQRLLSRNEDMFQEP